MASAALTGTSPTPSTMPSMTVWLIQFMAQTDRDRRHHALLVQEVEVVLVDQEAEAGLAAVALGEAEQPGVAPAVQHAHQVAQADADQDEQDRHGGLRPSANPGGSARRRSRPSLGDLLGAADALRLRFARRALALGGRGEREALAGLHGRAPVVQ